MSIKVYIHFEEAGLPEKTSKLSIPKSWVEKKNIVDVIELFTDVYNKSNPDHALVKDEVFLQTQEAMKIFSDEKILGNLEDRFDYFVKKGVYVKNKPKVVSANDGKVRCKNYGCNKYFVEGEKETGEIVCRHHTGPPIFHDLVKYWSCCPEKKAYDWDEFQLIEGCATSTCHSTVDPKVALGRADSSPGGETSNDAPVTVLKSITDYNTSNPDAVSATSSAVKSSAERKSSRRADGTAQCRNKGCNKVFNYTTENNSATGCQFHAGQAIFHDAIKYWSCCPDKKCYDFDSFLQVPGCATGYHDDGVIDMSTGKEPEQ